MLYLRGEILQESLKTLNRYHVVAYEVEDSDFNLFKRRRYVRQICY